MVSRNVEREYTRLVKGRRRQERAAGGEERRDCPRFQVKTADLWINQVPEFSLLDVSVSGIAILATYLLNPGDHIDIGLGDQVTAAAEVLGCHLVESPTQYTPAEFRINCRFADSEVGMELLVQAKRRELLSDPAPHGHG